MTTSQTQSFLTEIMEGKPIPVGKLEYFRARLQSRIHQLVLAEYLRQEDRGLHQADLARRIGRKPEAINRLLGAPGNWTLNTVSDLLLGMSAEPNFAVEYLKDTANQDKAGNLIEAIKTGQTGQPSNTMPTPQSTSQERSPSGAFLPSVQYAPPTPQLTSQERTRLRPL